MAGGKTDWSGVSLGFHSFSNYLFSSDSVSGSVRIHRGTKEMKTSFPMRNLTFLESFLEEVGLELYPEGRGALIGREQTTSEGK